MSPLSLKPANEFTIPQLAELMTRSFEGYFVPVNMTDIILHGFSKVMKKG